MTRSWGLDTIRVTEDAPRSSPSPGAAPWPPAPAAVAASIIFRSAVHWPPEELENRRATGTLEGDKHALRLRVWRDVHAGLADELRLVLDDMPGAEARIRALIGHLDGGE